MKILALFVLLILINAKNVQANIAEDIAFNSTYYADVNPDVKNVYGYDYGAAYNHYLNYGINEDRECVSNEVVEPEEPAQPEKPVEPETPVEPEEPAETTLSALDISKDAVKYFGQKVNYTPANGDSEVNWKIFYADNDNIYLIADDCIKASKAPTKDNAKVTDTDDSYYAALNMVAVKYEGASSISDTFKNKWLTWGKEYSSTDGNAKATAYLLDTAIWNTAYGNSKADYVIGAPTLEMFEASWNAKGYNTISHTTNEIGYKISVEDVEEGNNDYYDVSQTAGFSDTLYYPKDGNTGYWLASPTVVSQIAIGSAYTALPVVITEGAAAGRISPYWIEMSSAYGLRPVVCLNTDAKLVEESGVYTIK